MSGSWIDATKTVLQIWDRYLLSGKDFLFKVSLGLFREYEEQLLKISDTGNVWAHYC